MRLFIAVRLDERMRDALLSVQTFLHENGVRGNYTRPENLHLTLAFIGEYGEPERALDAMEAAEFAPFPLRLEGFGSFGSLYWCGLEGSEALSAYVRRLRRCLAESGVPFDRKRFTPHITLLRKAVVDGNRAFPGVAVPEAGMTAETISLMRSDRGKNGMIYTEIGRIPVR